MKTTASTFHAQCKRQDSLFASALPMNRSASCPNSQRAQTRTNFPIRTGFRHGDALRLGTSRAPVQGFKAQNVVRRILILNQSAVAQISNLLYRGFPIRQRVEVRSRLKLADGQPNGIRQYSRLEICATIKQFMVRISRMFSRIDPQNRRAVAGSAGVPPARCKGEHEARRRDASAPWFMARASGKLFFVLLAGFTSFVHATSAHPVAQGALNVEIFPEKIQIQARVAGEEIFVANTFAAPNEPKASSLAEVWQRHGTYLLQHLKVFADERALTGRVVSVAPAQNDFVVYQLEFVGAASPVRLRLEEDVLNEIEFAPGNPWEAAYAVRVHQQDRQPQEGLLLSRAQPLLFTCDWNNSAAPNTAARLDRPRMIQQYVRHGIGHILGGYDHLLFVAALILTAATFWDLVKVITAFTLAHTITLTLSVLNIVRLPSHVIEPMIAASIVFVAVTNLFWPKHSRGKVRLASAFFFGLFHGLGFAGGLLSAMDQLDGLAIGIAIAAFSLGVEFGHQMFVLPLFCALKLIPAARTDDAGREQLSLAVMRGGSLLISIAGLTYLFFALK